MYSSNTFTFSVRTRAFVLACSLALMSLLVAGVVSVWAQNMQDMPGMEMGKPKPKPKPTPTPQKKKGQPAPKKDDMEGMDMKGMPMPSTSPSSSPSASPSEMENMPGMPMPSTSPSASPSPSPSPEPSASPQMQMNMPQNQTPTTDTLKPDATQDKSGNMGNMDMSGQGNNGSTGQPAKQEDSMPGMKGMKGTGRMSESDPNALMIMSGNAMDIKLGASSGNKISMGQMGSGTSWQPATTPMHMWYKNVNGWLLFLHGDVKLGVNSQGGTRGITKFESQNWIMPMAFRRVGAGTLQLRGMFSLEPFTFSPGGSPELFQTGETYKGQPLIDKQHPHDLFMELSATYTVPLGERGSWFVYFGYPGEPALGPVAFMHRWSASENPTAPLSHHLQDSTHISFGVLTTGFTYRKFKLEGSVFNGREPDENRYNFEARKWNSHSMRFSFAPNPNWAMQVSYGVLKSPEQLEPNVNQKRLTASIQYNKPFNRGNWASALIWGRNHLYNGDETANLNGYTAESTVNFLDKNYLYTRLELVDKNELLTLTDRNRLGITAEHPSFRIGAYTTGYARDIWNDDRFSVALGSDVTFYSKPARLDPIYGSNPVSYKFFIRIRPGKMSMGSHNTGTIPATPDSEGDGQQPRP